MIRDDLERIRVNEGAAVMFRTRAEAEARVCELYATMSIREIARDLDTTVSFVQHAAGKAGLMPRPVAMTPGQPYQRNNGWQVKARGRA